MNITCNLQPFNNRSLSGYSMYARHSAVDTALLKLTLYMLKSQKKKKNECKLLGVLCR